MKQSLLIEIGCEDLPARYVVLLAGALTDSVADDLAAAQVTFGKVKAFATPRRLAVLIADVSLIQPSQTLDITGPAVGVAIKDGQPTQAALGFAKKCGVDFSELGQKDGKLHFAKTQPGKTTIELLPEIFEQALKSMDHLVPKRMRWGSSEETFVRPVQWLLALLGYTVVPLTRFGLHSGRLTYGHRFHAPAALELAQSGDYEAALRGAYVWADVTSRKAEIERQIKAEVATLKGHARINPELLDEVTALVEWPVVITGRMEQRFMELPPEVIVATVETNQRYFTVFEDASFTKLKPVFITIANIESRDVAQVIEGNERVVRPRLSDAMFFWEQDCKRPFADYREKLKAAMYQKDLGTVDARVERIKAIALRAAPVAGADSAVVSEAADLCKNDLVTKMVFEFPELQGLMGGYYAAKSGSSAAVARAIREHYLPTQQGTPIPSTPEGQVLALADKLDALAGIFAIGQKPTASKDPFALRRAANGVLRICIEGALALDVADLLRYALDLQPAGKRDAATHGELVEFVMDRLAAIFEMTQYRYEDFSPIAARIASVRATGSARPLDLKLRFDALSLMQERHEDSFKALASAHKRVRNILKQAGNPASVDVNPALLEHPAEIALFEKIELVSTASSDYMESLEALAQLREPVDAFFAAVMVNVDDEEVRANRLALLRWLDGLCREVADISLLPG